MGQWTLYNLNGLQRPVAVKLAKLAAGRFTMHIKMKQILASQPEPSRDWYVVHTKPRQEQRALDNLSAQGYECYLPLMSVEKLLRQQVQVVQEPLFSRYLFIRLQSAQQSLAPVRSTLGVSKLVSFGQQPAHISNEWIDALRSAPAARMARLFTPGDCVRVVSGPLQGAEGIYQAVDGERRAMVLIELLGQPQRLQLSIGDLRQLGC